MKSNVVPAGVSVPAAALPLAADDWAQGHARLGKETLPEDGLVDFVMPLLHRGRLFTRLPDGLLFYEVKKP